MVAFTIGGDWNYTGIFTASSGVKFTTLANLVTPNTVYIDTATGTLTYGAAPAAGWNLTGTNSGAGLLFGTNTANGYSFQVNSVSLAQFSVGVVSIGSGAVATSIVGPTVNVTALANVVTANAVYYNTGTGRLTYGALPVAAASWLLAGNAGILPAQYIGTSDAVNLSIRTGGVQAIGIDTSQIVTFANNPRVAGVTFVSGAFSVQLNVSGLAANTSYNLPGAYPAGPTGYLLSSTNAGVMTWVAPPAGVNAWLIGGNSGLPNPSVFGTLDSVGINLQAKAINFLTVDVFSNVALIGVNLNVTASGAAILFPSATTSLAIGHTGMPVTLSASTLTIGSVVTTSIIIGNALSVSTINGVNLSLPGLANSAQANVVQYNTATGRLSYAAAGAGGTPWLVGGNAGVGAAYFGTSDANTLFFRTNNVQFMQVDASRNVVWAAANYSEVASGIILLNGNSLNLQANSVSVFTASNTQALVIGATAPTIAIGGVATANTINGSLAVPNLANSVQANVVQYNSGTGAFSYAAVGAAGWNLTGTNSGAGLLFGTNSANGWVYRANSVNFATVSSAGNTIWTGGAQFNGTFGVNATAAVDFFSPIDTIYIKAGLPVDPGPVPAKSIKMIAEEMFAAVGYTNVTISAFGGNLNLDAAAGNAQLTASGGNLQLNGDTGVTIQSNNSDVQIQAPLGIVRLTGPAVNIQGLAPLVTSDLVYYNTGTGRLTYGAAAGGGSPWLVGGNAVALGYFGTSDNNGLDFRTNNITFLAVSSTQNVLWTVGTWALTASGPVSIDGGTGQTLSFGTIAASQMITIGNALSSVTVLGSSVAIDGSAVNLGQSFGVTNIVSIGNSGATTSIDGSSIGIGAAGNMTIQVGGGGPGFTLDIGTLNATQTVNIGGTGNSVNIDGSDLQMPSLPNVVAANVIYYNSGTGAVTYGAPSAAASSWLTAGNAAIGAFKLGSTDASTLHIVTNNVDRITILSNGDATFAMNIVQFNAANGFFVTAAASNVDLRATVGSVLIGASGSAGPLVLGNTLNASTVISSGLGGVRLETNAGAGGNPFVLANFDTYTYGNDANFLSAIIGFNSTGTVTIRPASVLLPNLANSAQANVVQYNTATGALTYAATAVGTSWLTAGNTAIGAFKLGSTDASALHIVTNNVDRILLSATGDGTFTMGAVTWAASSWALTATAAVSIQTATGQAINIGTSNNPIITIGSTAVAVMNIRAQALLFEPNVAGASSFSVNSYKVITLGNDAINTDVFVGFDGVLSVTHLNSRDIRIQSLATSAPTTGVAMLWDTVSKRVYQGAAGSGNAWLVGGNTLGGGAAKVFGSLDATDINFVTNNVTRFILYGAGIFAGYAQFAVNAFIVTSAGSISLTSTAGGISLEAGAGAITIGSAASSGPVHLGAGASSVFIGKVGATTTILGNSFFGHVGSTTTVRGNIFFSDLANSAQTNVLQYDTATGQISYAVGAAAAGWATAGNTGTGGFKLGATDASTLHIVTNNVDRITILSNGDTTFAMNEITFTVADTFNVNAVNDVDIRSSAGDIFIGANGSPGVVQLGNTGNANTLISSGAGGMRLETNGSGGPTVGDFTLADFRDIFIGNDGNFVSAIIGFGGAGTVTIDSGAVVLTSIATNTGTVAVPSHSPPAGFNYLCIDASGNVRQFSA